MSHPPVVRPLCVGQLLLLVVTLCWGGGCDRRRRWNCRKTFRGRPPPGVPTAA